MSESVFHELKARVEVQLCYCSLLYKLDLSTINKTKHVAHNQCTKHQQQPKTSGIWTNHTLAN